MSVIGDDPTLSPELADRQISSRVVQVVGGSVSIAGFEGKITLVTARPKGNFWAEIIRRTDDEATVVFTGLFSDHVSTIEARWADDGLAVELSEADG